MSGNCKRIAIFSLGCWMFLFPSANDLHALPYGFVADVSGPNLHWGTPNYVEDTDPAHSVGFDPVAYYGHTLMARQGFFISYGDPEYWVSVLIEQPFTVVSEEDPDYILSGSLDGYLLVSLLATETLGSASGTASVEAHTKVMDTSGNELAGWQFQDDLPKHSTWGFATVDWVFVDKDFSIQFSLMEGDYIFSEYLKVQIDPLEQCMGCR